MEQEYKKLNDCLTDLGVSPLGALIVACCAEHLEAEHDEVMAIFAGGGLRTLPRLPTKALPWVLIHVVANRFMASHTKDGLYSGKPLVFYPTYRKSVYRRHKGEFVDVIKRIFTNQQRHEISEIGIWLP